MQETGIQSLGWEDSSGEGNDNPLQYSWLENPMGGGAWQAIVHGVTKGHTWATSLLRSPCSDFSSSTFDLFALGIKVYTLHFIVTSL